MKEVDYWGDTVKLLSDPLKFLKRLKNYDRDNISDSIINKMKVFLDHNPGFTP